MPGSVSCARGQSDPVSATCTPGQTLSWVQSIHYLKYLQEPPEGGILYPTLQMWKLRPRGLSQPGRGRAGFGLLVLLALKTVHCCPWLNSASPSATLKGPRHTQGPTCSSSWHTLIFLPFLFPLPMQLATRSHLLTRMPSCGPSPRLSYASTGTPMGAESLPPSSPGHSTGFFRTRAFPDPGKQ